APPSRIQRSARCRRESASVPGSSHQRRYSCHLGQHSGPSGRARPRSRPGSGWSRKLMGKVFLIGAGPGDPELLTVRAVRLLERATIVLHDSLVSREVLALVPQAAQVIDVGKRCGQKLLTQEEINALLVSYSAHHDAVIRLKGGDPL